MGECQKCGQPGHVSQDCRASEYMVKMYKKLQQLREGQKESHSLDAPSLDGTDLENYMMIADEYSGAQPVVTSVYSMSQVDEDIVLLDSGSIHTILWDPKYFKFLKHDFEAWRTCELSTVARRRTFRFREGRAWVTLRGGATLICDHAIYAPAANRSVISFRDLRLNGIHVLTLIRDGEETLDFGISRTALPLQVAELVAYMSL